MKMQRFWVGRALLLAVAVLYAGGYVRAQEAKDTLTLTLDRALEIALSDNPTIKVAEEEIALKKVTHKETWQNLLPQAISSIVILFIPFVVNNSTAARMIRSLSSTRDVECFVCSPIFLPFLN